MPYTPFDDDGRLSDEPMTVGEKRWAPCGASGDWSLSGLATWRVVMAVGWVATELRAEG